MRSGFSLLELSIVLVIIGLLAGGVMVGQSLIRAAELRSISSDLSRFQTAVNGFRDKYQALPGDMKNATAFWGAAHASAATCTTTQGTGTATCNGDGDGWVGEWYEQPSYYKVFRFWQQLANAGLIEGTYTGVPIYPVSVFSSEGGVNVPAGKINSSAYFVYHHSHSTTMMYSGAVGNMMFIGSYHNGWMPDLALMTPSEAWNVDTKLDDGKPGLGRVMSLAEGSTAPNCATGVYTSPASAVYALTTTGSQCVLFQRF